MRPIQAEMRCLFNIGFVVTVLRIGVDKKAEFFVVVDPWSSISHVSGWKTLKTCQTEVDPENVRIPVRVFAGIKLVGHALDDDRWARCDLCDRCDLVGVDDDDLDGLALFGHARHARKEVMDAPGKSVTY